MTKALPTLGAHASFELTHAPHQSDGLGGRDESGHAATAPRAIPARRPLLPTLSPPCLSPAFTEPRCACTARAAPGEVLRAHFFASSSAGCCAGWEQAFREAESCRGGRMGPRACGSDRETPRLCAGRPCRRNLPETISGAISSSFVSGQTGLQTFGMGFVHAGANLLYSTSWEGKHSSG